MLEWILSWISGNYNQKNIDKLKPLVAQANHWYQEYESLKEEDFPKKTQEFKERIAKGETVDDLLPEAFGLVKQACKRLVGQEIEVRGQKMTWDMIPYDVQLLWGIILHQWTIAEMKTWEGKTLVAVAPVYLNALEGKGVHVVTVNDYLASRDSDWMGYVYRYLGLTVGSVTKKSPLHNRRQMYECDITYIENSELWFDFLRDNLVKSIHERNLVWRPLHYAIVDEIDSILIDEARTPLIISEASAEATDKYTYYAQIVRLLKPCSEKKKVSKWLLNELLKGDELQQEEDGDYYIDEKTKTVSLSGLGIKKLEEILKVENLYKDIGYEEIHHIENALRSQAVYQKDREYIVVNGEVLIVDEHTGRTMPGRRFSEGLHQAIEAKEAVHIQRESRTMATITYQNFFKQYKKLAGMTGTATTEGEEFEKIYELSVLEIPTNKPTIRCDRHDKVYFNQAAKWKFVKEYIKFAYEIGQPILIGTSSIDTSEHVSKVLDKEGITHYVLNAKFHEQEAHIVSQAGKFKSVVVATNMAWRGTDIKLEKWLNAYAGR
jgi:preprotein translocase subunit SecA